MEREVRYCLSADLMQRIKDDSKLIEEPKNNIDIVCGYNGFDSLRDYGFICRVRQKSNKVVLEIKKRISDSVWEEYSAQSASLKDGVAFFSALGMKPYLYINRTRSVYSQGKFKIFFDNIDMLGDFVELEYVGKDNMWKTALNRFLSKYGIDDNRQKLYGDIFKDKIQEDEDFKQKFTVRLDDVL